ncbi:MAG TPA: hypothetical protein ACFCUD_06090 [Cyclobacteriaceae bacterium]
MKLADIPSCLGGEDHGINIISDLDPSGSEMMLTTSWRFESFSYSDHFWVNVVY